MPGRQKSIGQSSFSALPKTKERQQSCHPSILGDLQSPNPPWLLRTRVIRRGSNCRQSQLPFDPVRPFGAIPPPTWRSAVPPLTLPWAACLSKGTVSAYTFNRVILMRFLHAGLRPLVEMTKCDFRRFDRLYYLLYPILWRHLPGKGREATGAKGFGYINIKKDDLRKI